MNPLRGPLETGLDGAAWFQRPEAVCLDDKTALRRALHPRRLLTSYHGKLKSRFFAASSGSEASRGEVTGFKIHIVEMGRKRACLKLGENRNWFLQESSKAESRRPDSNAHGISVKRSAPARLSAMRVVVLTFAALAPFVFRITVFSARSGIPSRALRALRG
jgi:hypothetical protein